MSSVDTTTSHLTSVRDVACTVCGCVCDDLTVTTRDQQLVSVDRACHLAEPWFHAQATARPPAAEIQGAPSSASAAIGRACEILAHADAPLIYGLSRSSTPGQRAAVALADQLGAIIDTTASLCHGPSIMAVQSVGESTCTLGEIRNRADLVIFWGCNPSATHPRHAERYSVFPTGRWTTQGRADRTVVMIGDERHVHGWSLDAHGARPDRVVPVRPHRDFELIMTLRALISGQSLANADYAIDSLGISLEELIDLANLMKGCECGVVFFGLGLTESLLDATVEPSGQGHLNVENLLKLVADLNAHTRFHARRMRIQGDVSGADSVMCWQTGYPFAVSLSRTYPRYNPGEFSAMDVLERSEVDACLIVGSETVSSFPAAARRHLESIPTIVLDYPAASPPFTPTVKFTTAVYGLHAPGTIYRMDEVPLSLRPSLETDYPTDETILKLLAEKLFPQPTEFAVSD